LMVYEPCNSSLQDIFCSVVKGERVKVFCCSLDTYNITQSVIHWQVKR